jgi:hypothetical protein
VYGTRNGGRAQGPRVSLFRRAAKQKDWRAQTNFRR